MRKPVKSSFFQRPATRTGWWSGILAILAIVMIVVTNLRLDPLAVISERLLTFLLTIFDIIMLGSILVSIVLGIIAVAGKRDRSWLVWLFIVPVLYLILLSIPLTIKLLNSTSIRSEVAPTPDANIKQIPVIFDDDGSPDGTSALLFLLSDPRADVRMVSISSGEAHPQVYIQHLGEMLERYGYGNIPLGAGQDTPLGGGNAFPEFVREASDGFWGFASSNQESITQSKIALN